MAYDGDESDLETGSSSDDETIVEAAPSIVQRNLTDISHQEQATQNLRGGFQSWRRIIYYVFNLFGLGLLRSTSNEAIDVNRLVTTPTDSDNTDLSLMMSSESSGAHNKREQSTSDSSAGTEIDA